MAAPTPTGTPVAINWAAGADPAAQNVTVPADATLALFAFALDGLDADGEGLLDVTLGGVAPTGAFLLGTLAGYFPATGLCWWVSPPTGTQALNPAWTAAPVEGPTSAFWCMKDAGAPRDVDGARAIGATAVSVTLTTVAGAEPDSVWKFDQRFDTAENPPFLSAGWTNAATGGNVDEGCRLSYIVATGTSQVCNSENEEYSSLVAVAIPALSAPAQLPPRHRRQVARQPDVGTMRRRRARIALPGAPAALTSATGRASPRGDAAASHGVLSPATGRAGALGAAPAAKAAALAADGRAGARGDAGTSKAVTIAADGRLSPRGSVVSAEGAVHGAIGRAGALGSVATVAGFGAVTQATGRAGARGAAPSTKESPSSATGRVGVAGTATAAKGLTVQADGRAGARGESAASKAALHGASGSLAARGAALSAEGAVHGATGRLGARASVTTAAAFGLTTIASGRAGARGAASATKAVAADAAGRAGPRSDVAAGKATAHTATGRAGLRGAVDTSGIPPIETTAVGRLAVRGAAITVQGPAGSTSSGSSGVGRLVTPSYRLQPPRRKRREGEEQPQGAAVDLAPGPLAGTASAAAASTAGAAPAQPEPAAPAAPADRWRLAREQDREFETQVLHHI